MKNYKMVSLLFLMLVCLIFPRPVIYAGEEGKIKKPSANIRMAQYKAVPSVTPSMQMPGMPTLSGSIAYAENLWSHSLYSIDVTNPGNIITIGPASYSAFCSDFLPGDTQHVWIIDYTVNALETVDISTGLATFVSDFPCPVTDGVWSCLSINKTTGQFWAIATNGTQSVLYQFEPFSGTLLSAFDLNIQAVISSTFDYSGALYVFDVVSDSIYNVDVNSGIATAIGYAGFDGNYAQGMGYDPVGDEIYLSAFAAPGGPQLRRLDRTTGNTIYLANLPGSTCAFSFPIEFYAPFAQAGNDASINENQTWMLADASAAHYSSLIWTTSGDGSFSNSTTLHPTYYPGSGDISNGLVHLCLTAMPLAPNIDSVIDCMTLFINTLPSGLDFGDAPEFTGSFSRYPTTFANNGARHMIDPTIYLGYYIDGEPGGQPNVGANGDDIGLIYPSGYNDEDGVTLPAAAAVGTVVTVNVRASVAGYLDAWMDFDIDYNWWNPDDHVFTLQPLTAGMNTLTFLVPGYANTGQSYLRFRFRDYDTPLSFDGLAYNGEVEDYTMMITGNIIDGYDFGDAPQGDGTHFYPTLLSNNGARHYFVPGIYLGAFVDTEPDGQPNNASNGDDIDLLYPSMGNDEDGVALPDSVSPGSVVNITVNASVNGYLDAWMDFNRNGIWNDAGEHIFTVKPLNAGLNLLTFTVSPTATPGQTYLRFRFRDYNTPLSYDGIADNGEVEDYTMKIIPVPAQGWDFGDAPEGGTGGMFPTLLSSNGAHHVIVPGIFLGNKVDPEPDGQPGVNANGDDLDALYPSTGDDEDGVVFTTLLTTGQLATIKVTASTSGFLDGWIDFDGDGTWSVANEHVFTSLPIAGGINTLSFTIPANADHGTSYARFRFRNSNSPLTFTGLAENGEVEDYKITIRDGSLPLMDYGDAPEDPSLIYYTFPTTLAQNGATHIILPGIYLGNYVDGEPDGQPSANANGDDTDLLYPSSGDDEDGVGLPTSVTAGSTVTITVTASVAGFLDAWMDFDLDHTWYAPDEHIFSVEPLNAGLNTFAYIVPDSANTGQSYLRFRFRDYDIPISFDGIAYNGEVEDYSIEIVKNNVPVTTTVTGDVGNGQINCYNATQTISVAGGGTTFIVQNGGIATMIAGQNIIYYAGTKIIAGGYLHGYIAPNGPWCDAMADTIDEFPHGEPEPISVTVKSIFSIYPNPTTGGFSLELKGIEETAELNVEMYGILGERVFSAELQGQRKYNLSLSGKPNGVYFIRVVSGKFAGTGKIIKQ